MNSNNLSTSAELAVSAGQLLNSHQKRRYEREMALKMMFQEKNQDLINEEQKRVIKNLERQIQCLTEDNDWLRLYLSEKNEQANESDSEIRTFAIKVPLITYNECNTMVLEKNKKSFHNSQAYEDYKRRLWQQFDKYGDELRSMFPTIKDENKYVEIKTAFHVNNMNKDTDNIEKPFLDTLFNWLNKGRNQNGRKLYSDNQLLKKESSKVRNSGTIMTEEEVYFQVIPLDEKIEKLDDFAYRFLRYHLNKK